MNDDYWARFHERASILESLIDLENKVYICLQRRVEFLELWNKIEVSYQSMLMKMRW